MKRNRRWPALLALMLTATPLVTTATCDPFTGTLTVFRDDDHFVHDGFFVEEVVVYEDCFFFECF